MAVGLNQTSLRGTRGDSGYREGGALQLLWVSRLDDSTPDPAPVSKVS